MKKTKTLKKKNLINMIFQNEVKMKILNGQKSKMRRMKMKYMIKIEKMEKKNLRKKKMMPLILLRN
jgi:ribonucleotide reductase alpha subunit